MLEIQPRAPALRTPQVARLLEHTLGVILEFQQDPGQVGRELMEGHDAVDASFVTVGRPRDPLVRYLFGDVRLPRPGGERDLRRPVCRRVVLLVDALNTLGEPTELFELRPLVVGHRDWYADVDALLDQSRLHRPAAVAPAAAEQVADLVLH